WALPRGPRRYVGPGRRTGRGTVLGSGGRKRPHDLPGARVFDGHIRPGILDRLVRARTLKGPIGPEIFDGLVGRRTFDRLTGAGIHGSPGPEILDGLVGRRTFDRLTGAGIHG